MSKQVKRSYRCKMKQVKRAEPAFYIFTLIHDTVTHGDGFQTITAKCTLDIENSRNNHLNNRNSMFFCYCSFFRKPNVV